MKRRPAFDANKIETKLICSGCVGERHLKARIKSEGKDTVCSYCENEEKTISIKELTDQVEKAFASHYERTSQYPDEFEEMKRKCDPSYDWERHGDKVVLAIAYATGIEELVAKEVQAVLEGRHGNYENYEMDKECEFDRRSYYTEKDPGCRAFTYEWSEFERRLKTETRFFSSSAHDILAKIFSNLDNLRTEKGEPVLVNAGPNGKIKFLHRARAFAGEDKNLEEALKYPWMHLGPPPMQAASAGRMNARGISVFYGAIEAGTALAEVRPPVGSQVAVAKFEIIRPLRLLDVEALKSVIVPGSIFDPKFLSQLQRAKFLEILSARISRPIMPNEEALEYLATQAVADYLATEANLDGIIFPSVQVGHAALNVVLFHHASMVEMIYLPKGTDVTIGMEQYDDEGVAPDYVIFEVVMPQPVVPTTSVPDPFDLGNTPKIIPRFDLRKPCLTIDLPSVTVHQIKAVEFKSDAYPVERHRHSSPEDSAF